MRINTSSRPLCQHVEARLDLASAVHTFSLFQTALHVANPSCFIPLVVSMADQTTTLRQLLSRPKPALSCTVPKGRNSSYIEWPHVKGDITIWEAFNLRNLIESYGHVLNSVCAEQHIPVPGFNDASKHVEISKSSHINYFIARNDILMRQTLPFAKSQLGLHPGINLQFTYTTADKLTLAKIPNYHGRCPGVDHVIALDDFPSATLVVGLGRPASYWSGMTLANRLGSPKEQYLWPLRQLGNLCNEAHTRYGYIQTDQEMVVCCFSMHPDPERQKVAIMPIPWSKYGGDVLTTDLALWWLCMLAMSDQTRDLVMEEDMVKIDDWHEFTDDQTQCRMRRHLFSKFDEPVANNWFNMDNSAADAELAQLFANNPTNF